MRKIIKFISIISACLAVVLFSGCGKRYSFYTNIPEGGFQVTDDAYKAEGVIEGCTYSDAPYEKENTEAFSADGRIFYCMGAEAKLTVATDFTKEGAREKFEEFRTKVNLKLKELDGALSTTVKNSDINAFNDAGAGAVVKISEDTYKVLQIAKSMHEFTNGAYNPALYYNVLAYGFGTAHHYPESASELPSDDDIKAYTDLASKFGEVTLSGNAEEGYFVSKPDYTVEVGGEKLALKLDLGGIGKGYAVDCVERLFDEYGYTYGNFNFSASSMLLRANSVTDDGKYTILLINPRSPSREEYIRVTARNEKMSTSGDNEQFYIIDNIRYCHIIDPATGKPVQTGISSATVIGGSAAEDDALTTAIMAMGKDEALNFIKEKLTDRRVIFTVA